MSDIRLMKLKNDYLEAEKILMDESRRNQWLERQLYKAPTMQDFNLRLERLREHEKLLRILGLYTMQTRYDYETADVDARRREGLL